MPPLGLGTLFAAALLVACGVEGADEPGVGQRQHALSSVPRLPGTNTQDPMPDNLQLADIDGDGTSDFVQHASNKIFVYGTDFKQRGMLHRYLERPISRLIVGRFDSHATKDSICAVLDSGLLQCFNASTRNDTLWWWFSQGNFIKASEEIIVADYDGNGRDDLMLYDRNSGQLRFYTIPGAAGFQAMPSFSLGNLSKVSARGYRFRAGDFNGDGRSDLIAINSVGQILRFDSVAAGGVDTFWWGFTTASIVQADEQVTVARVTSDLSDEIVLHSKKTGVNRFFHAIYDNGLLTPVSSAQYSAGQLKVLPDTLLFWGRMHGALSEPGAGERDDAIVVHPSSRLLYRSDARYDSAQSKFTYWSAYNQYAPANHQGWAPFSDKSWLILKCKLEGEAIEPQPPGFFRSFFANEGKDGVVEYYNEISYGSFDLRGNGFDDTWYTMSMTTAEAKTKSRAQLIADCLAASGKSLAGHVSVIALLNVQVDSGASGKRVVLDPKAWNVTFATHEMGHGFGLPDSLDDIKGQYWDLWDIMSAMNVWNYVNPLGLAAGPGMNAPNRMTLKMVPAHRIRKLSAGSATVELAALNRPESFGSLVVQLGNDTDAKRYTVEFRQPRGWDRGLPQEAVLVHEVKNGKTFLLAGGGAAMGVGDQRFLPNGAIVGVESIDSARGTAKVKIAYP